MFAIGIILFFIITLAYYWSTRKYNHWKGKCVPHIKPIPFFGNYSRFILQRVYLGEHTQEICRKFPDEPLVGAYFGTEPILFVQDPKLIKLITTKDFYYFNGRENTDHTGREHLTKNLFFTGGDQWKILRQNLSPIFTSGKMKSMFHFIEERAQKFSALLADEVSLSEVVDIRDLMTRYVLDCLCACVFGINARAMENEENPFRDISRSIFTNTTSRAAKGVIRSIWPDIFYLFKQQLVEREIIDFFDQLFKDLLKERNNQPSDRNDFIDLLITIRNNANITGDKLNSKEKVKIEYGEDWMSSQCLLFFSAGFDTSAISATFTLYEIAKKPEVQKKVQEEIDNYIKSHGNRIEYDCVSELVYLQQCVDEALRLYPVLPVVTREVMEEYQLSGVKLEKGSRIHIPIYHLHHNPKYFENPEEFIPERFSPEEKTNIQQSSYIPFGDGARICIGQRFAKMQMFPGLVTVLRNFWIEIPEGEPEKVKFDVKSINTASKEALKLKMIPRKCMK